MSSGKIPWGEAAAVAEQLVAEIRPIVRRVKTVGSVRRRKEEVGDLELLVEPLTRTVGFFAEEVPDVEVIRAMADRWGTFLTNGDKQMAIELPMGMKLELYICTPPAEWGSLLAIRTGPAVLSAHAMTCMISRGYKHRGGHVETRRGDLVPTPREEDFFAAAGLPCLAPRLRHTPAAFRSLQEVSNG